MIFGDISTRAQNDQQCVGDIACNMVMKYGMSTRPELLTYTHKPQSRYLDPGMGPGEGHHINADCQPEVRAGLEHASLGDRANTR